MITHRNSRGTTRDRSHDRTVTAATPSTPLRPRRSATMAPALVVCRCALAAAVATIAAAVVLASTDAGPSAAAAGSAGLVAPSTEGFGYTGGLQYFQVPAGVDQVQVTAWGGSGGAGGGGNGLYEAPGGFGAKINLEASVAPGQTLALYVGGEGAAAGGQALDGYDTTAGAGGTAGGSNAVGGPGGNVNGLGDGSAGGGGGAATAVMDPANSDVLVIAAGGGGGGGGGINAGANGGQGGDGGSSTDSTCDPTDGPGAYGSGVTGGAGGACAGTGNGAAGVSGSGETPGSGAGTGGGGGGGLDGGDGGAAGGSPGGGGGGGGAGISYWSSTATGVVPSDAGPGNGGVVISWMTTAIPGFAQSQNFLSSSCCATQTFTVPAGVTQLSLTGWGGTGGSGGGPSSIGLVATRGGLGAQVSELVPVTPGDVLEIDLGGAGGAGTEADFSNQAFDPLPGGSAGASSDAQQGGAGGSDTQEITGATFYAGGTGGGGGGATQVVDETTGVVLLDAGGGGGGGGDSAVGAGYNGGPGGSAGSPIVTGNPADGAGYYGSGAAPSDDANGSGGPYFAGNGTAGADAAANSSGTSQGTGGGGGGGAVGGGAGAMCTGTDCDGSAGGGAAGSSTWAGSATDVEVTNALEGPGQVMISWTGPAATSTTLSTSRNPVRPTTAVTLHATVTPMAPGTGQTPVGTVTFVDDTTGQTIGSPVVLNGADPDTASVKTILPVGTQELSAVYSGDPQFVSSTSPTFSEHVIQSLVASPPALALGTIQSGTSATSTITLTSGYGAKVTLPSLALTGSGVTNYVLTENTPVPNAFTLVSDHCSGTTLAPLGTCTVGVQLAPPAGQSANYTGTLTVHPTGKAKVMIALSGSSLDLPQISSVSPPLAPPGTEVTITGENLGHTISVNFGSAEPVTPIECTETQCTVTVPPPPPGGVLLPGESVFVTATNAVGTSATNPADQFIWEL